MPEMRFLMLLTTFIEVIRRIRAVDRSVRNVKSSIGYGYAGDMLRLQILQRIARGHRSMLRISR